MRIIKSLFVAGVGGLSALYLLNPTAGFIELLPDALPGVGNVDEFFMAVVLLRSMKYFGIDLLGIFGKEKPGPGELPVRRVESRPVDDSRAA